MIPFVQMVCYLPALGATLAYGDIFRYGFFEWCSSIHIITERPGVALSIDAYLHVYELDLKVLQIRWAPGWVAAHLLGRPGS